MQGVIYPNPSITLCFSQMPLNCCLPEISFDILMQGQTLYRAVTNKSLPLIIELIKLICN